MGNGPRGISSSAKAQAAVEAHHEIFDTGSSRSRKTKASKFKMTICEEKTPQQTYDWCCPEFQEHGSNASGKSGFRVVLILRDRTSLRIELADIAARDRREPNVAIFVGNQSVRP
jgi:hypothetical protein